MENDKILETIYAFADEAHGDQMRKYTPERYMVHPKRVMKACVAYTNDVSVLAAALLHDVLEDTPISEEDLQAFLRDIMDRPAADKTLKLVVELTDVYEKSAFPHLNRRQRKAKELERMRTISPEAQTIKYADIIDNCQEIVQGDRPFAPVFLRECEELLRAIEKGNPELRERAQTVISTAWKQLR